MYNYNENVLLLLSIMNVFVVMRCSAAKPSMYNVSCVLLNVHVHIHVCDGSCGMHSMVFLQSSYSRHVCVTANVLVQDLSRPYM